MQGSPLSGGEGVRVGAGGYETAEACPPCKQSVKDHIYNAAQSPAQQSESTPFIFSKVQLRSFVMPLWGKKLFIDFVFLWGVSASLTLNGLLFQREKESVKCYF